MPITATRCSTAIPLVINGVKLTRKNGQFRQRFSDQERRAVIDATDEELDAFARLFTPRICPYLIQCADHKGKRGDWKTVHHCLTEDLALRHLLANQLPGPKPLWVGAVAWDTTRFIAVDVDIKDAGFADRCDKVERTFYRLGIPKDRWLVQESPSGGRHYYVFTYDPIPTDEIRPVFERAGLVHQNGAHEIYPSQKHGFRLPFGWVPGKPYDPTAWKRFIADYESGRFPRVNWKRCIDRAAACEPTRAGRSLSTNSARPKRDSPRAAPKAGSQRTQRSRKPNSKPLVAVSLAEVEPRHMLGRGIQAPGERRYLTLKIAWYLIHVRKLGIHKACELLVEWVYRTGRHTSADVQNDERHGTRKVADDTRAIVAHTVAQRSTGRHDGQAKFAQLEIDHLLRIVQAGPERSRKSRMRFAIDFLNFAKNAGRRVAEGLECSPSINGIVRQWRGCSKMSYKPFIDWAIKAGLIEKTREKRQSPNGTGRARTYLLRVPQPLPEALSMSYTAALRYASEQCDHGCDLRRRRSHSSPCGPQSDTYSVMIPSLKGRTPCTGKASDRVSESVTEVSSVKKLLSRSTDHLTVPTTAESYLPFNPRGISDEPPASIMPYTSDTTDSQCGCGQTTEKCQHSPRTSPCVASRSDERAREPDDLSRLLHPPAGHWHSRRGGGFRSSPDLAEGTPAVQQRNWLPTRASPESRFPPDPTDQDGITMAVEKLRELAALGLPRRVIQQLPCWPAIEAMAADPSYTTPQRRLLLTPGTELSHQQVCSRNQLITQWRRRQNE